MSPSEESATVFQEKDTSRSAAHAQVRSHAVFAVAGSLAKAAALVRVKADRTVARAFKFNCSGQGQVCSQFISKSEHTEQFTFTYKVVSTS